MAGNLKRAEKLLGFSFVPEDFDFSVKKNFDRNVGGPVRRNIEKLNSMSGTLSEYFDLPDRSFDIDSFLINLKRFCGGEMEIVFSSWELKNFCYFFSRIVKDKKLVNIVLELLADQWSDLYFYGLVDFLLNSWDRHSEVFMCVASFVAKHLGTYRGYVPRFRFLADNNWLLSSDGPMKLGLICREKSIGVSQILNKMKMAESRISYRFFGDVIYSYFCSMNAFPDIDELDNLLHKHKSDTTVKRVIPYLMCNLKMDRGQMTRLYALAIRYIGKFDDDVKWCFPNGTDEEKDIIRQAHDKLVAWVYKKYIYAYFINIVDDQNRSDFWVRAVKYIEDVRFVGSAGVRENFRLNPNLKNVVANRYITTDRNSDTSAIVMRIRDRIFVEFSDVGSLYVYKQDNFPILNLESSKYTTSINDFKEPGINLLIDEESSIYEDSGRMTHQGYWTWRLNKWFQNVMHIYI